MAGIEGLGGYSYQMRVFIYYLSKLSRDSIMGFEFVDDLSITKKNCSSKFKVNPEAFSMTQSESDLYTAIQVKQTNIGKAGAKKILYNWLITKKEYDVEKYVLWCDARYKNKNIFDNINIKDLFEEIQNSNKSASSLIAQVKQKYQDYNLFDESVKDIFEKIEVLNISDVDNLIYESYMVHFHYSQNEEEMYQSRVRDFVNTIESEIINTIIKREHFTFKHSELMDLLEVIQHNINRNGYLPSWGIYRDKHYDFDDPVISNSREFKQISLCNIKNKNVIMKYLRNKEFYYDYRIQQLDNSKKMLIRNIEGESFSNYEAVLENIEQGIYANTPYIKLVNTTGLQNAYHDDKHCQEGACIYLTGNGVDKDLQISWGDAEDEEN